MTHKYIVSIPGLARLLCIEAEYYTGFPDNGAKFYVGNEVVASIPETGLIAKATCLPDFPALSQFKGPDVEFAAPCGMTYLAEPVRGLDPLPAPKSVTHNYWDTPARWPFLAGLAVGALGGVVGMLAYAFV